MFRRPRLCCVTSIPILIMGIAPAQMPDEPCMLKIDLPNDSPVTVVSVNWGRTRSTIYGGAVLIDLHASLSLRNLSHHHIRGISLNVVAEELAAGGKGAVLPPSLNVAEGETFPVRIDLRLIRPVDTAHSRLIQVKLDGVLFDNLQFFGPDKLSSRRSMTARELYAQLDRERFNNLLASGGTAGLRKEILTSLSLQRSRSHAGRHMVGECTTNYETEHNLQGAPTQSQEKERLAQIYCRSGMQTLLDELNRFDIQ